MKTFLTVITLFVVQISIGQVQKNLGDFNAVKVFDRISVELVPADANKIVLSGSRSKEVELINKNGELHIRMPLEKLLQGEEINAVLYYKKLNSIDASEGSTVSSGKLLTQPSVDISAKEGSQIRLMVEADRISVKSVTGAIVSLTGEVKYQDISMGTGGVYNAKKLISGEAIISINAGGEADIYATNHVEATVRAGGDITVYGNPKELQEKIVLGGTVTRGE